MSNLGYKLVNAVKPDSCNCNYGHMALLSFKASCSKKAKNAWLDDNYRQKVINSLKLTLSTDESKQLKRERSRQLNSSIEHRQKVSKSVKYAYDNNVNDVKGRIGLSVRLALSNDDIRQKYVDRAKLVWQRPGYKQMVGSKISAKFKTEDGYRNHSKASKLVANRPEVKARCALITGFRNAYKTSTILKCIEPTGDFQPYMHFIIIGEYAIVFLWDTRQFLFHIKVTDLPDNYVICNKVDSYHKLINFQLSSIINYD
jgi:hypothetical protein